MIQNCRRFCYILQLKVSTYFKNKDVEAGFTGNTPIISNTIKGIVGGFFFLVLLSWIAAKIFLVFQITEKAPSTIQPENKISKLSHIKPMSEIQRKSNTKSSSQVITDISKLKKVETESAAKTIIATAKIPAAAAITYMRVIVNLANVRQKPLLESNVIAMLWQGFIVRKIDRNENWIYIATGIRLKGWIHKDLLENADSEDYQLWKTRRDKSSVIGLIKNDLDNPARLENEKNNIKKLLRSWKTAWEEKDVDSYISFYSKAFTKSDYNRDSYKNYKKAIFSKPGAISIEIKNIQIRWEKQFMTATFIQEYRSGFINSTTTKMAQFQSEKDGWKIVNEFVVNK